MVKPQAALNFMKISFLVVSLAGFEDTQYLDGLFGGYNNKLSMLGQRSILKLFLLF